MTARLREPLLIEIQEDEIMEDLCAKLDEAGFLPRFGMGSVYPYETWLDAFYDESGTYPTHLLLSSSENDPFADGLSASLCGEEELYSLDDYMLCPSREADLETLVRIMESW